MFVLIRSYATFLACVAAVMLSPRALHAEDVAAAARAYSQAQAAELEARHARAAGLYELADRISPAPEALRGAARTRHAMGDRAVAATHAAELLRRYPEDAASRRAADRVLSALSDQLGRVEVACDAACTVSIDGAAVAVDPRREHVFYADPGEHRVSVAFSAGGEASERIALRAGERSRVALEAPPVTEPPPPPPPGTSAERVARSTIEDPFPPREAASGGGGISKAWFVTGAVVTVGLAAAATWSGLDVLDAHERYEQDPTEDGYRDGRRRERRTNLLLGGASVAAAGTVMVAIFTDWSGGDERADDRRVGLAPAAGGALVTVGGGF